jgi:hypothetical protein
VNRRNFLRLGLLAGSGVLFGGAAPLLWGVEESAVLHHACRALFPGLVVDQAVEGIARYREQLPLVVQLQLQGLLRGLERMPLVPYGASFTQLSDDDRAAFLRGLAQSELYPRRLLFHGLKQTCAMGVYSLDGNWPHLGYEGPMVQR